MKKHLRSGMMLSAALLAAQMGYAAGHVSAAPTNRIEREVRRELLTLPFYSVFDHFSYRVDGDTVTLMGKVSRPALKSDAERAVKGIEGVVNVSNRIEVLPLSTHDDRLRLALYRAIYGHGALQTLAVRALPPIHIIVENGNVTLEGWVGTALEKTVAGTQANGVPGVFSVVNNLQVENRS